MEKINRKDRKNTKDEMSGVSSMSREHQRCQQNHRGQQERNRVKPVRHTQASRRKSRRKRALIHRMTAITILIGLGIAVIFLLRGSLSEGAEKAAAIKAAAVDVAVTKSTVVASSKESTSAADSQGEEATDAAVKDLNATTDEAADEAESTDDAPILHDTPDTEAVPHPFNQMSADWSEEDLKGWWRYTIPDDFERTGGYLPDIVQAYTYSLCKQNNIRYALVLAIMEIESGYQYDAVSGTNDIGYMQVNYKWQQEKMPDMTEKALYNPYVNIRVGIEYLVELSEEFSTEEAVLTAYHYGPSGAYSRCYKNAVITSDYADKVLTAAQRIEAELQKREAEVKGEKGGKGGKGGDGNAALD